MMQRFRSKDGADKTNSPSSTSSFLRPQTDASSFFLHSEARASDPLLRILEVCARRAIRPEKFCKIDSVGDMPNIVPLGLVQRVRYIKLRSNDNYDKFHRGCGV